MHNTITIMSCDLKNEQIYLIRLEPASPRLTSTPAAS